MVRILFVDDVEATRDEVASDLRSRGFDVDCAENGFDAMAMLAQLGAAGTPPDVVLSDVDMPLLNGLWLTRCLKGIDGFDTPVLLLTGRNSEFDAAVGRHMGADGYLCKPYTHAKILAGLSEVGVGLPEQGGAGSAD